MSSAEVVCGVTGRPGARPGCGIRAGVKRAAGTNSTPGVRDDLASEGGALQQLKAPRV